jgi:hypothetical protein
MLSRLDLSDRAGLWLFQRPSACGIMSRPPKGGLGIFWRGFGVGGLLGVGLSGWRWVAKGLVVITQDRAQPAEPYPA